MFLLNTRLGAKASLSCASVGGATERTGEVASGSSEAAVIYTPQPPPHHNAHHHLSTEKEELRMFWVQFKDLSGRKMEINPSELMDILNKALAQYASKTTDSLGIDTCRSVLAVMDSETNGKLGFREFKYLWNNVKKWQAVYIEYASPLSRRLGSQKLPNAFAAAGFQLNPGMYNMMVRRYSDDDSYLDFENFIRCLVRLDAMFRAFKSLEKDGSGYICLNAQEWLQVTLYS